MIRPTLLRLARWLVIVFAVPQLGLTAAGVALFPRYTQTHLDSEALTPNTARQPAEVQAALKELGWPATSVAWISLSRGLVQGDGYAPDQIVTGIAVLEPELLGHLARQGQRLLGTQPGLRLYVANPLTRYVMEWYFVRVFIYVTPRCLTWWDGGDFYRPPHSLEVSHVEADRALPA